MSEFSLVILMGMFKSLPIFSIFNCPFFFDFLHFEFRLVKLSFSILLMNDSYWEYYEVLRFLPIKIYLGPLLPLILLWTTLSWFYCHSKEVSYGCCIFVIQVCIIFRHSERTDSVLCFPHKIHVFLLHS